MKSFDKQARNRFMHSVYKNFKNVITVGLEDLLKWSEYTNGEYCNAHIAMGWNIWMILILQKVMHMVVRVFGQCR